MKKVYYLKTCSTCQRILKELNWPEGENTQNIKTEPITEEQLDEMKQLSGSFESLFSRKAMKYRSMGLNEMELSEADYKKYILEEYTFLKRPVFILNDEIFIGNSKKTIEAVQQKLQTLWWNPWPDLAPRWWSNKDIKW